MEAVGLSCWWFASRGGKDEFEKFDPKGHIAEIKAALESVDSLSNVKVQGDEHTIAGLWAYNDDDEYYNFFPLFASLIIAFDLFLPKRVQEKYNAFEISLDNVETFHIKLICKGVMPVAYIHYSVQGAEPQVDDYSPSRGAMIVRKYLEDKLGSHPKIEFQSLGPSPFHADVFLAEAVQGEKVEPKDLSTTSGYRTFYFPSASGRSSGQIAEFIDRYHATIAAFYTVVRNRNYRNRLSQAVTDGAMDLLQPPITSGRWATFQYWRAFRQRIDDVFEALLQEKINRVRQIRLTTEIEVDDEKIERESLFYPFVQRELRQSGVLPDEDIRELLVMLEDRRRGYFENAATLFSGLAGGILGALLGAALTFGLTYHQVSGQKIDAKTEVPALPAEPSPSASDKPANRN